MLAWSPMRETLKAYFRMEAFVGLSAASAVQPKELSDASASECNCEHTVAGIPKWMSSMSQSSEGLQQAGLHAYGCVTTEAARQGRSALDMGVFMIRNTRWSRTLLNLLAHRARTTHSAQVRRSLRAEEGSAVSPGRSTVAFPAWHSPCIAAQDPCSVQLILRTTLCMLLDRPAYSTCAAHLRSPFMLSDCPTLTSQSFATFSDALSPGWL